MGFSKYEEYQESFQKLAMNYSNNSVDLFGQIEFDKELKSLNEQIDDKFIMIHVLLEKEYGESLTGQD